MAVKNICGVKHNAVSLIFSPELEPYVDFLFSCKDLLFLKPKKESCVTLSGSYPRSECLKEAFLFWTRNIGTLGKYLAVTG